MESTAINPAAPANAELRDFAHSLPMALLRSREAVMECFRPLLTRCEMTEQQWRILRALSDDDAITISHLCNKCCISKPSMTGMLQRMEERGLIKRKLKDHDQRITRVYLTRCGKNLISQYGPESETKYKEIELVFGKKRLNQLHALLTELENAASRTSAAVHSFHTTYTRS